MATDKNHSKSDASSINLRSRSHGIVIESLHRQAGSGPVPGAVYNVCAVAGGSTDRDLQHLRHAC